MSLPFLCHFLPVIFLAIVMMIMPLVGYAQMAKTSIVKTIVLDPGHGGKDPGNLGTKRYKTTEKDIALSITLLVGNYLSQAFPEMEVIYTRDDDSYPELIERTKLANEKQADLFISIHCNANESRRPVGADTWVMGPHKNDANLKVAQKENAAILMEDNYKQKYGDFDPNSPETYLALSLRQNVHLNESLMLAKYVQDEFKTRVGRVDRGVKQSGFFVISFTTMPSILIEVGFLTNPTEEDFLNSVKGQDYMASAIYRAIKKYIADVENVPVTQLNKVVLTDTLPDKTIVEDKDAELKHDTIASIDKLVVSDSINYRIQLFVSSEKKNMIPENFNGLDEITFMTVNNLYKYYYAKVPSYAEAKNVRKIAQEKGYSEAFIVSFRGETKIELQEALNLELENIK
jgi:N-acetylmuramoyl-L-alanine amidase